MIITSLHLQLPFGLVTRSSELLRPGPLLPVSSLLVKFQLRQDRLVAPSDFLQVFAEIRAWGQLLWPRVTFCWKVVIFLGARVRRATNLKFQRELFSHGKAHPLRGTTAQPNTLLWQVHWLVAAQGWWPVAVCLFLEKWRCSVHKCVFVDTSGNFPRLKTFSSRPCSPHPDSCSDSTRCTMAASSTLRHPCTERTGTYT